MRILVIGRKLIDAITTESGRLRDLSSCTVFGLDDYSYDVRHVNCYLGFDIVLSSYRVCLLHLALARRGLAKQPLIVLATSARDHLDKLTDGRICDKIIEPETAARFIAEASQTARSLRGETCLNRDRLFPAQGSDISPEAFVQFMSYIGIGAHGVVWWEHVDDVVPTFDEEKVLREITNHYIRKWEEHLPNAEAERRIQELKHSTHSKIPPFLCTEKRRDIARKVGTGEIRVSLETAYRQARLYYKVKESRNMDKHNLQVIRPLFKAVRREDVISFSRAFMIMPFDPMLTRFYEEIVKTTANGCGIQITRADDFFTTGQIMEDVWNRINEANFVIADLTGRNPNVFYELGIAHTLGKPVILLSQAIADVPFDVRHHRVLTYSLNFDQIEGFSRKLEESIASVREEYEKASGLSQLSDSA